MRTIFKFITTILFLKLSLFSFAAEYYWVGGSGYWDDINHWRTTSGGNTIPNWIPGIEDNVYFDDNSNFTEESKTILFRTDGLCNNISFIGTDNTKSPILLGTSNNITIAGSSIWQTGMEITLSNIYYIDNNITTNRSLKSNNVIINANIYIRGTGTTQLSDNLKQNASKSISIENGSFISNSFEITTQSLTTTSSAVSLTLGSSIINSRYLSINTNTIVNPNTTQINLETGGIITADNIQLYNVVFNGTNGTINGSNITFNHVEFKGRSTIYANGHKFNQLILAPEYYHQINPGSSVRSITIVELLKLDTPQCSAYSTLSNSEANYPITNPATIITERINTEILVSNSIINLINISGLTNGIANNSILSQDNLTGWITNSVPAPDLYWVGGSGNWNDKSFWSLTSGGPGGACVPGPYNNTFFNNDSKIGTINNFNINITSESYTKSITFSESINPRLNNSGATPNLNIYGSATFNPNQLIRFINLVFKNTSENKTFDPKGLTIDWGHIYFDEEKTIALLSDLTFTIYGITIRNGTLDLTQAPNQITVTTSSINEDRLGNNTNLRALKLGNSKINLISGTPSIDFSGGYLTLDGGTSTITFTENYETSLASNIGILLSSNKDYNFYNVIFNSFAQIKGSITEGRNTFNILEINNSSYINSSITVNELYLSTNRIHTFVEKPIITIQDKFIINDSDCGDWTILKSRLLNEQSTIKLSASATISTLRNLTIEGIKIIDLGNPTRSFNAINSINDGNNDGWSFSTVSQGNLYWIGGQGNWSDPNHWSFTSGGSPTPNSCIPNPLTNTFFNQDSGFSSTSKSVFLDIDAFTNNITFQGSGTPPSLEVTKYQHAYGLPFLVDNSLNIHGNSILQEDMTTNLRKVFYKKSYINPELSKTIRSNNVSYNVKDNIYLDAPVQYDLEDSFHLSTGSLIIRNGDFYSKDYNIKIENSGKIDLNSANLSSNQLNKSLNLGNSTLEFNMNASNYNVLITNNTNSIFNAGTSTIIFRKNILSTSPNSYFSVNNGQAFHNITFFVFPNITQSNLQFNNVYFYQNANITGNNNSFNTTYLAPNQTFLFQTNATQNINNLVLGGTPCAYTVIDRYNGSGTSHANLNITGGEDNYYNYTNINNINAVGKSLHFEAQSEVGSNNINITSETQNRDSFPGLGTNWLNHIVDTQNPDTYILKSKYFNPNTYSTFEWKKTTGLNSNPNTPLFPSTENKREVLDFRPYGYGTFNLKVTYSDFLEKEICSRDASLLITPAKSIINPNLKINVKQPIREFP